ncbi:MAG TPA: PDZ domain-containing protein [Candidatus Acidoferrales bacterium]|jgi:serine protease Do|nr:PDZ domain-containing protein [Candidatus Acidoferrales bacterium]
MSKRLTITLATLAVGAMSLALPGLLKALQVSVVAPEPGSAEAITEVQDDMQVFGLGDDRGWLGVTVAEVTAEKVKELKLPAERGVLVVDAEANGPAAKAGLRANDVITELNGQRLEGTAQFRRMIREIPTGRAAQVTLWRDGRTQSLSVTLGSSRESLHSHMRMFGPKDFDFHFEMPEIHGFAGRPPILGIDAEDLRGQLGSYFGAPDGEGVLVREVKSGTPAEKAGLKAGDVVTKVDGERVRTVSELRQKMREKREKKTVSLSVIRKGAEMSLNVEVEQPKPPEGKKLISRRTRI